jgi:rare lipoprotein A
MKFAKSGLLICTTIILAACSNIPERKQEVRTTPTPVIDAQITQPQAANKPAVAPNAQSATASQPGRGAYLPGDGPGVDVPANLDAIPDAVPHDEPLHRFANRPYVALGKNYTPMTATGSYKERGIASWYGKKFHGQHTSSGETYDMYAMTAAHPTLPIPSYARVTNLANGKSVVVRVNDRGPFLHERIMDLSYTAAYKLGYMANGSSEVEVESLLPETTVPAPLVAYEPVKSEALPPETLPPALIPVATVASAPATAAGNVYLQIGAFKSQQGAESFMVKMRTEFDGGGKDLSLFQKGDLVRVHIGPYASADEARAIADKLQAKLGFKPLISLH